MDVSSAYPNGAATRSSPMTAVLMKCPSTGSTVPTGSHVTRAEESAGAVLGAGGSFRCASCNQIHTWTKGDVTLSSWPGATSVAG